MKHKKDCLRLCDLQGHLITHDLGFVHFSKKIIFDIKSANVTS